MNDWDASVQVNEDNGRSKCAMISLGYIY